MSPLDTPAGLALVAISTIAAVWMLGCIAVWKWGERRARRDADKARHPASVRPSPLPAVMLTHVDQWLELTIPLDCDLAECLRGLHGPESQAAAIREAIELAKYEAELKDRAS